MCGTDYSTGKSFVTPVTSTATNTTQVAGAEGKGDATQVPGDATQVDI